MELTDEKIELNGMIHKGVGKILILMAILSIVYGIAFTLLEKISVARTISAFFASCCHCCLDFVYFFEN